MSLFAVPAFNRLNPVQGGARGMRVIATGLLILMAAVYLTARSYEPAYPWVGYIRAFSEAAMVGGLADWFAVTALFRHPLGLPIPHTAIIPRNKDRIGDTLALFLRDNFLTPSVVARRMQRLDVGSALGRWLAAPPADQRRVAQGAGRLVEELIEALADDRLGGMVKSMVAGRLRRLDLAPPLGQALTAAIGEDRHIPLFDSAIGWAGRTLEENEALIRSLVHDRSNAIMRWTGLDEKLADAIVSGLTRLMSEMAANPEHPLRLRAEEALKGLADDLREDPATRDKVARMRDALLDNPAMANWIEGLWQSLRSYALNAARNPNSLAHGQLGQAMRQFGQTILDDAMLRTMINRFTRRTVVGMVARYGDGIVTLVSETIRSWDARTITSRLENAVGRDLQYIRINGTIVGGLVGLVLHASTHLF